MLCRENLGLFNIFKRQVYCPFLSSIPDFKENTVNTSHCISSNKFRTTDRSEYAPPSNKRHSPRSDASQNVALVRNLKVM